MNGLEAILNRIMNDAEEKVLGIKEQTDIRCAELLAAADQEAVKVISDAKQQAEVQATILMRRSESLSTLEMRKQILTARQILVDETIERAAEFLRTLSPDLKDELYQRLLLTHAQGSEAVAFSKNDEELSNRTLKAINQKAGWQLTLDPEQGSFSGGFILRQGLIEINMTIELLIRSRRPELVSLAAQTIFGT